jgi:hypothetical protein
MRSSRWFAFSILFAVMCAVAPQAACAGSRLLDFVSLYEYLSVITNTGDSLQSPTSAVGDYVFRDEESWCAFWHAVEVTVLHTVPASQCAETFNNPVAIAVVAGAIGSVEFAHEYVPDACGFAGGDVQTQCIPSWP